jgi:antitoxin YobK
VTIEEFTRLVEEARSLQPHVEYGTDPPATDEQLATAERELGVRLPPEYRAFAKRFGGGEFGFEDVFSVADGEWNLVNRNRALSLGAFIAISPNGTGDHYGFVCEGGECRRTVSFFDHETDTIDDPAICMPYEDFFAFLCDVALDVEA